MLEQINKNKKAIAVILFIANVSFICYYLMLAIFNRPSQDDWIFLKAINSNSMTDFLSYTYQHQSGRLTGYFLHTINFSIFDAGNIALAMPILSYSLSVVFMYLIIKRIVGADKLMIASLSFFMVNALIICNFEFSAFYWCCASLGIWGSILYVYLFVLLVDFKDLVSDKIQIVIIALLKAFSSEVFTPLFAGLLFLVLLFRFMKSKSLKQLLCNTGNKWISATIVVLLIGTAIVVAAPGNYERASEEIYAHPSSIIQFLVIWIKNIAVYFYLFAFKLPYMLGALVVMFVVGMNGAKFPIKCSYKQFAVYSGLLYLVFVVLSVFPMAYIMSGFGFHRFYTPCIFVGMVILAMHGWKLGEACREKEWAVKNVPIITVMYLVLITGAMVFNLCYDTPIAKAYAESVDKRTEMIMEHKNNGDKSPLELDKLSDVHSVNFKYLVTRRVKPVLYLSDEISVDPNSYSNMCISGYYDLDFPIMLKQE